MANFSSIENSENWFQHFKRLHLIDAPTVWFTVERRLHLEWVAKHFANGILMNDVQNESDYLSQSDGVVKEIRG